MGHFPLVAMSMGDKVVCKSQLVSDRFWKMILDGLTISSKGNKKKIEVAYPNFQEKKLRLTILHVL